MVQRLPIGQGAAHIDDSTAEQAIRNGLLFAHNLSSEVEAADAKGLYPQEFLVCSLRYYLNFCRLRIAPLVYDFRELIPSAAYRSGRDCGDSDPRTRKEVWRVGVADRARRPGVLGGALGSLRREADQLK